MKCLALCLLLAGFVPFAQASRRISVAELNQIVAAQKTAHTSDTESAKQLEGVELTERLTTAQLQEMLATNTPGPRVAQALELLADTSTFLDSPLSDLLRQKPAPDVKKQLSIVSAAVDYVALTLQHLPDFVVSRNTKSFDNVSTSLSQSGELVETRLHLEDAFSSEIAYRDGREVIEEPTHGKVHKEPDGLRIWGEFGPILATVLRDAIKGQLVWSHWETEDDGKTVAVFHYSVPKNASHYRLNYCCTFNTNVRAPTEDFRDTPAYHGSLFLDPESGAVRRITVEADITGTDVVERADIAVEYGDVEIGGKTYVCPLRGVALSVDHYHPGLRLLKPITRINEIRFVNYHKFGSSARILADAPNTSANDEASGRGDSDDKPVGSQADLGESSIATPQSAPPEVASPAAPAPQPVRTVNDKQPPPNPTPVFKVQTQNVLVDVVVLRKDGSPVLGLTRDDFEVKEDGKAEDITFFDAHRSSAEVTDAGKTPLPKADSSANEPRTVDPEASAGSSNVILLDMLNTSPQNQMFVQQKLKDFLRKMKPGSRIALFVLGSDLRCIQGFTSDPSALIRALDDKSNHLSPQKIEPSWNSVDEIEKEAEITRIKKSGASNIEAVRDAYERLAREKRQAQMLMTIGAIHTLAQKLVAVPGRKNLLWFAETFPVYLSTELPESNSPASQESSLPAGDMITPAYVDKIKEVSYKMTTARIAVYPIEAEGVMNDQIFGANLASPGSEEENQSIRRGNYGSGVQEEGDMDAMYLYKRYARNHADTIMAMERLAAETGGKAFFNTNALDVAAAHAMGDGANYYTIGYSPSNKKMDGQYRTINVKVRGKYVVSYRRGYFADSKTGTAH